MAENVPPQKKCRLSYSLKKSDSNNSQFALIDDIDVEVSSEGVVPTNTAKNNTWAARNFSEWVESRNQSVSDPDSLVPDDLLTCTDPVSGCAALF